MTQIDISPPELAGINARLGAGDVNGACDLARDAYISGVVDPLVLTLVAHRMEERGEIEGALSLLNEARLLEPGSSSIYANIGHCLLKLARPMHALESFNRALKINVRDFRAHHGAGLALTALGDEAAGAAAQARAHQLDPNYPAAIAALAMLAYRKRDYAEAERLSAQVLRLDPDDTTALIVTSALLWEKGDAEACIALLEPALASSAIPPLHRSALERQLADALDKLGRYDEAFRSYEAANLLLRRVYQDRFDAPDIETTADVFMRLLEYFRDYEEPPFTASVHDYKNGTRDHVFLMSFPRSGTTLLEQVLAGHPDVEALEEMPTLDEAIAAYVITRPDLSGLMSASEEELDPWRELYWRNVARHGVEVSGKIFIDKQPALTPYIPLIRRLFPNAKILFAIRDPRDVVLGCFRRTFAMRSMMYEYTSLEKLANLYALNMSLAEIYFNKMDIPVYYHKHETLVSNFEAEVDRLCAFLNIEMHRKMLDIVGTTVRRDVKSPSARQIRAGLNASGVNYWVRYEKHLEGQFKRLEPWVDKYGYERSPSGVAARTTEAPTT